MSGFTPGPWFSSHRESVYGGYRTEIYTEDGEVVATAAWYARKLNETTMTTDRDSNARLIAAAPRMYVRIEALAATGDTDALNILEQINGHS